MLKNIAAEVATITLANGGTTYDLAALHTVAHGVAVAVPNRGLIVPVTTEAEVAAAIAGYLATHSDDFAGGAALGTWLHNGDLFLDVVRVLEDLDEAETAAAAAGELAIFVLDTAEELPIPTTALHHTAA